jgi:hypothetical protein
MEIGSRKYATVVIENNTKSKGKGNASRARTISTVTNQ